MSRWINTNLYMAFKSSILRFFTYKKKCFRKHTISQKIIHRRIFQLPSNPTFISFFCSNKIWFSNIESQFFFLILNICFKLFFMKEIWVIARSSIYFDSQTSFNILFFIIFLRVVLLLSFIKGTEIHLLFFLFTLFFFVLFSTYWNANFDFWLLILERFWESFFFNKKVHFQLGKFLFYVLCSMWVNAKFFFNS